MLWGRFAEQPPAAGPSKVWGFRSPSHAPCPGQAWSAVNAAVTRFPLPQAPRDKHSRGKGNTRTGTIPSHPPAPSSFGVSQGHSNLVRDPSPGPYGCPMLSQSRWSKGHLPPPRAAAAGRDAARGGPTVWQAIPIPSARAAAPVCREPSPSSGDGQWQRRGAAADPTPAQVPVPASPSSAPGRRSLAPGGAKNVACNSLTK